MINVYEELFVHKRSIDWFLCCFIKSPFSLSLSLILFNVISVTFDFISFFLSLCCCTLLLAVCPIDRPTDRSCTRLHLFIRALNNSNSHRTWCMYVWSIKCFFFVYWTNWKKKMFAATKKSHRLKIKRSRKLKLHWNKFIGEMAQWNKANWAHLMCVRIESRDHDMISPMANAKTDLVTNCRTQSTIESGQKDLDIFFFFVILKNDVQWAVYLNLGQTFDQCECVAIIVIRSGKLPISHRIETSVFVYHSILNRVARVCCCSTHTHKKHMKQFKIYYHFDGTQTVFYILTLQFTSTFYGCEMFSKRLLIELYIRMYDVVHEMTFPIIINYFTKFKQHNSKRNSIENWKCALWISFSVIFKNISIWKETKANKGIGFSIDFNGTFQVVLNSTTQIIATFSLIENTSFRIILAKI